MTSKQRGLSAITKLLFKNIKVSNAATVDGKNGTNQNRLRLSRGVQASQVVEKKNNQRATGSIHSAQILQIT